MTTGKIYKIKSNTDTSIKLPITIDAAVQTDDGNLKISLSSLKTRVLNLESGIQPVSVDNVDYIYHPEFTLGIPTGPKDTAASTTNICTVKSSSLSNGAKLTVHIPIDCKMRIYFYASTADIVMSYALYRTTTDWLTNGSEISIAAEMKYNLFRLEIAKLDGTVPDLNENYNISYVKPFAVNILTDNESINVIAAKRTFRHYYLATESLGITDSIVQYPLLLHISDTHGDNERLENFIKFGQQLNADCCIHTGDLACTYYNDSYESNYTIWSKYKVPYMYSIGNHDVVRRDTDSPASTFAFNYLIAPFIQYNDYKFNNSTAANKTYYYKDIDSKKLRLISLDTYENSYANQVALSTTQLSWLCSTLLSTPAGYGIVLCYHYIPEFNVQVNAEYAKFWYRSKDTNEPVVPAYTWSSAYQYQIVFSIIDAFTSGSTYIYNGQSYNFSTKQSGVEFIAHLNGHLHADKISYISQTQISSGNVANLAYKQLWLNIASGAGTTINIPGYSSAGDYELAKEHFTINENCFNAYIIDRANKAVTVVRIGSKMLHNLDKRDYMTIPYYAINM